MLIFGFYYVSILNNRKNVDYVNDGATVTEPMSFELTCC